MTGAAIEIKASIHGADDINRRLFAMLRGVENREPLMDEIGAALVTSTQFRFEDQQGPDGLAWVPSERALAENGQTLVDKGLLLASITHLPGNDQVEVGSNMVYAGIHQFGGRAGRGHKVDMPARPYLGISFEDETEIDTIVHDYLAGLI